MNGYLLRAEVEADGSAQTVDLKELIDGATEVRVDAAKNLAGRLVESTSSSYDPACDFYSVAVSATGQTNVTKMARVGWMDRDHTTVHITPGTYTMTVGIHDLDAVNGYYKDGKVAAQYVITYHEMGK